MKKILRTRFQIEYALISSPNGARYRQDVAALRETQKVRVF
jgi:hypothetical protein